MPVRKNEDADLRKRYPIYIEVGLVVSLLLLILAFRVNVQKSNNFEVKMEEQEVVEMEEVQQTKQEVKPPPPPRPPVPVEVPNDEVIEDEALDLDASLDLNESIQNNQPPPPPPEEEEEEEEQEVFIVVEEKPELIGGMAALQGEVRYPEFAKKAGIEGRVFVQFVVDESGNVQNPRVTRGVHKLLDQEAVRAVKQMKFKPGKQRGQAVKVQMSLPVTFRLR
jgi:protein TonB